MHWWESLLTSTNVDLRHGTTCSLDHSATKEENTSDEQSCTAAKTPRTVTGQDGAKERSTTKKIQVNCAGDYRQTMKRCVLENRNDVARNLRYFFF